MMFAFNSLCVFVYLVIFSVRVFFFCNLFILCISPQDKHHFVLLGQMLYQICLYKKNRGTRLGSEMSYTQTN